MSRGQDRNNNAAILGFSAIVALLAVVMWIVGQTIHIRPLSFLIPWPLLTLGFAVADVFTVHIEFKENAHSFSLNEIPLVLGLAFISPTHLIVARVLGGFIAIVVARRQRGVKLIFNTTLFALEATSAVALYSLLLSLGTNDVSRWLATFAAMIGVNVLASAAVGGVISIASGSRNMSAFKRTLLAGAITTSGTTCLALVSVDLLKYNTFSLGLILMLSLVMFIGYRGYAALQQRYANLQRLYDFTGALARSAGLESAVRSSLTRAQELMRAASSKLYLLDHGIVIYTKDDELTTEPMDVAQHDWVWNCVIEQGLPVLLTKTDRDHRTREYLDRQGHKDMMMAPLVHRGQVIGALAVHDRLGDVSTFDDEDRKVFETLANHACISIQNSRLIDQLREEVDAKNHQALHDMLTGLGNRRLFGERTDEALALADRGSHGAAVLLLDLNRFKEVNDSLGHHCGDMLLKEVGERLLVAIPKDATVCRLGGDEFAVLLPTVDDDSQAIEAAAAISSALEEPYMIQDLALGVGAAIGVALSPQHGRDSATLLRHADVAMYQSKESHTAEVYDPERDQASARRLALAVELREAIEQQLLEVYFQPKIALHNGRPVGAEALLRWERPGHGFVSPDEFIPLAESVGLMRPLTALVLKRSLLQALKWEQAGYPIGIAVNLSARSILDLGLPEEIALLLSETGLEPNRLTLEITEGQLVSDQSRTITVLERLAALGVSLSIDDFGTGYSSLSYLQRLPVNEIKIDKSFVLTMASHVGNASIVRSVIDLARNLGLSVVAEGVEDKETLEALTELGCHVAQGYFISRPVPAHEFMRWLTSRPAVRPVAVAEPASLRVVNG